jgi:hypothetical protein
MATRCHVPGTSSDWGVTSSKVNCAAQSNVKGTGTPSDAHARPSRHGRSEYDGLTVSGLIGRSNWIASVVLVGIPWAFAGGQVTSRPGVDGSGKTATSTEFTGTSTNVPPTSPSRTARIM